jgi:hypothetical protein
MTPTNMQTTAIGRVAIAIGAVTIIGLVFIAVFFASHIRFFGSLNDACIALAAILGAVLAWLMHPVYRAHSPRWSRLALAAAVTGALIVTLGAWLVISATTGYFLAALYMTFGNAFLGLWVLGFNRAAAQTGRWPRRLTQFGQATGIAMLFGLITLFGILGSEADFFKALHEGVTPSGRQLSDSMPWKGLGKMTDDELKTVWLYLQSLPKLETATK